MPTIEEDREVILKLHKDWWEANHQLLIPLMEPVFPTGDSYLMFNLNGHPYFGIEEKVKLWEFYQKNLDIVKYPDIQIMRFTISGDMAYIASEGFFPLRVVGDAGTGSATWEVDDEEGYDNFRLRGTEVYQRDDGSGNPVWKMWHFHCSPMPDGDEERPGLGGTPNSRGLGQGPGISSLRVTDEGVRS